MHVNIHSSWEKHLKKEFEKPYFHELLDFLKIEYVQQVCFPPENQIFNAFNSTPFDKVKVVVIGQDPYHGDGQANGLAFSVQKAISIPPSLKNIYKELAEDLSMTIPTHGDLTSWSSQGVLLLNATLTVRAHEAGSHQKRGWERFTDTVIKELSEEKENLVFLLWGGYAKKKGAKIDRQKHLVLESGHPSPLSANRGLWFGNKHFSATNDFLLQHNQKPIQWEMV